MTHATRFVSLLDAGPGFKTTTDRERGETIREAGFDVEFQIPIFDFGEARTRQAEQTYLQAVNRLLQLAVNVRSEARNAYRTYRSTYDIAEYYPREILPLSKIINEQSQLQYGAMQTDVFALVVAARERNAANRAAVEAKLAFWLADSHLRATISGGAAESGGGGEPSPVQAVAAGATE